ncbi:MAG: hypothetical protein GPJ51_15195, partial [Candidatus Heimdallarchaeota archaeon]|nr:hypothetical protein [Candidatus Heimdallarchaeota archaeon]
NSVNTSIRERFEEESTLFNVTDGPMGRFCVDFTISDNPYVLFVELEIDPLDGLTKRYYEHFTDYSEVNSIIELTYIDYYVVTPSETSTPPSSPKTINGLGLLISFVSLSFLGVILIRRRIIRK